MVGFDVEVGVENCEVGVDDEEVVFVVGFGVFFEGVGKVGDFYWGGDFFGYVFDGEFVGGVGGGGVV